MIILKVLVDLACGALNSAGGFHWLFCRRYIMPTLLAITLALFSHTWWIVLTVFPVIGTLCLGYFPWGWIGRGLWLFLQAVIIGLGVTLSGHLQWFLYLPYVTLSFILGATLYNLEQLISDAIFGVALGLVVCLVH